jgi:plastocyanin
MNQRGALVGLLTACALLLVGCGGGGSSTTAAAQPTPSSSAVAGGVGAPSTPAARPTASPTSGGSAATPQPVAMAPLVVTIRNYAFVPQDPVVARGQKVVVVNDDSVAHTWTAAPHSGWSYDSGNIAPGGRATFPGLPRPGRYPVLCLYHAEMPAMTGTLTVR